MTIHADDVDEIDRQFLDRMNEFGDSWFVAMLAAEFGQAAAVASTAIREFCSATNDLSNRIPARYLWTGRVLFNGFRDLAEACRVVAQASWLESSEAVESAWLHAHDAKERLLGDYFHLVDDLSDFCATKIDSIINAIDGRHGRGWYVSPEIILEKEICSVCEDDIRGCSHVPGRWYGETRCTTTPIIASVKSVDLVAHARDPRCRIWPWIETEKSDLSVVLRGVPLLMAFSPEGSCDNATSEEN